MILIDAGPLVALFDPRDSWHHRCRSIFQSLRPPFLTTVPVLTEAFYMLRQSSFGARRFREFILAGGTEVWFLDQPTIVRIFELMGKYADHPMDFADASLIAAAEMFGTRQIFTVDHNDFSTYRIRKGNSHVHVEIIK